MVAAYNYAPLQATALRLIQRFGMAMTLNKQVSGAYSGGVATVTPTAQTVSGVKLAYTAQERAAAGTIEQDDFRVLMAASGVTNPPAAADQLVIGGNNYQVVHTQIVGPAGTDLVYDLQVRA